MTQPSGKEKLLINFVDLKESSTYQRLFSRLYILRISITNLDNIEVVAFILEIMDLNANSGLCISGKQ